METLINICFAGLLVIMTIDFWFMMRHFDDLHDDVNEILSKIDKMMKDVDELKNGVSS